MDPRTALRILNQEMTKRGWTKQIKNDFVQVSPRGEEFQIQVSPSQRRFHVPVFSPFIDFTPLEAYDLCESHMKYLHDFLKQGKYKWCEHKSFSTFSSVMKMLQLRAGPQEECYKLPAVILYKEIVRQLNLSSPAKIQYYDGTWIDSPSVQKFKLEEAYAIVEFIKVTRQMNHRAVTGRYENYAQYNHIYTCHLKAAVQLREATEKVLHVRIVGLEPKTDDESGGEDDAEIYESDESDDEEELDLVDYFSLRHPKTLSAKTQPAVAAKETSVTKEEKNDAKKLETASVLSENNKSIVPAAVAATAKLPKEKESAPASFAALKWVRESDPATDERELERTNSRDANGQCATDLQDELNARGNRQVAKRNGTDKDIKRGARVESEKENHPDATVGSVHNPGQSKSNQKDDPPGKRIFGDRAVLLPGEESLGMETDANLPKLRKAATSTDSGDAASLIAGKQVPSELDSSLDKPVEATLRDEKIITDSVSELKKEVEALRAKNEKVIANLRTKKALLEDTTKKNQRLEDELSQARNLHTQIASLRTGIENLTATGDNLRNRLRIEKELHTQARLEKEKVQRQLKQTEKVRAAELELLDLYREFGNHSGFHGWGKRIRKLEAQLLEQQNSLADHI
jgi:hypothetical protein